MRLTDMYWCYGCMDHIEEDQWICPHCGYDNSRRQNDENLLREGSILNGKYLVGRKLGQSGFSVTYLGIELNLNIKVAIKEYFPKGMSTRASGSRMVKVSNDSVGSIGFLKGRDDFQYGAQAMALFDSPSLVHFHEFFLENNTAYIVTDYVDGIGLDDAIRQSGGKMHWQRVVSLMMGLMPELDRLHQKNFIHRNIKPSNLKVVTDKTSGKERLVLLDFGAVCNFASADLTGTFTTILTMGYAPYEQYLKRFRQGPYTDVYALCATMYNCITGTVPPAALDRGGDNVDPVVPIAEFGADVPDKVSQAIMHGLEIRSENRPQTMRELYDELNGGVDSRVSTVDDKVQNILNKAAEMASAGTAMALNDAVNYLSGYSFRDIGEVQVLKQEYENKLRDMRMLPSFFTAESVKKERHQTISFGHYFQFDHNTPEPIEWFVLTEKDNRILLLSRYILDTRPFHQQFAGVTWEHSDLRIWLNTVFYDRAFTYSEKSCIAEVSNITPDNRFWLSPGGNAVQDRISLLSIEEVEEYLENRFERQAEPTGYTGFTGSYVYGDSGKSDWWLRSSGFTPYMAACVHSNGSIGYSGNVVFDYEIGVRPSLWLNL